MNVFSSIESDESKESEEWKPSIIRLKFTIFNFPNKISKKKYVI